MTSTTPSTLGESQPKTGTISGLFALLLKDPLEVIGLSDGRHLEIAARLFAGSLLCFAAYGAALGIFGGGWQIAVAAMKVPLVIYATLVLSLPSFYVFTALAGSDLSLRASFTVLLGFAALLGLLLCGFLPIAWLFAASTKSELFLTWINVLLWLCSIVFAIRFLRLATAAAPACARTVTFWAILFFLVSLQMTTHLRPILWQPGDDLFDPVRLSFFEHLAKLR